MFLKRIALAAAAVASIAIGQAQAADISFTGNLSGPNDVLLFNFTVSNPSTVTLRTYSYAGGTNANGQVIERGGFDPILALFDGTGLRINENDDGDGAVPADVVTGFHYDTFLQSVLTPGDYTVSVMAYSNFSIGPYLSNGFENDGNLQGRGTFFAFDVLNVDTATQTGGGTPVPEPASMALFGTGIGALALTRRRRPQAG